MASFKDYTTICCSAPSEFLSKVALKHRERLLSRNLEIALSNLRQLEDLFARHADKIAWHAPRAGCIAFPRLRRDHSSEAFCDRLRETNHVLLLPSTKYEFGDRHFRLGFGRKNMPEGLAAFDAFLENLDA